MRIVIRACGGSSPPLLRITGSCLICSSETIAILPLRTTLRAIGNYPLWNVAQLWLLSRRTGMPRASDAPADMFAGQNHNGQTTARMAR